MIPEIPDGLVVDQDSKILLLVLDGLGGIPFSDEKGTALAEANTPNMDQLASENSTGLMDPVEKGVIPGSPAGHLALFGYNPVQYLVGRGILSALGINFDLRETDVACRVNFCTLDQNNIVQDRRAGRISTEENQRLCEKIRDQISLSFSGEYFFRTVSEHRALLVIRDERAGGEITDTDPHRTGVSPQEPEALTDSSQFTVDVLDEFLRKVRDVLGDEPEANMILTRGYDRYDPVPDISDRFKLNGAGFAGYPMYRGVARYVGISVPPSQPPGWQKRIPLLKEQWNDNDFFFFHVKKTDSYGEDGNFEARKEVIENVDQKLPEFISLDPDVIAITGDHCTPAKLRNHSWHPVPVLLGSEGVFSDGVTSFSERAAARGSLGQFNMHHLMSLMLSNAGRTTKFGP